MVIEAGDAPEIYAALEERQSVQGSQRLCRYALKGDISYRACTSLFQCASCEFGQILEDTVQQNWPSWPSAAKSCTSESSGRDNTTR